MKIEIYGDGIPAPKSLRLRLTKANGRVFVAACDEHGTVLTSGAYLLSITPEGVRLCGNVGKDLGIRLTDKYQVAMVPSL